MPVSNPKVIRYYQISFNYYGLKRKQAALHRAWILLASYWILVDPFSFAWGMIVKPLLIISFILVVPYPFATMFPKMRYFAVPSCLLVFDISSGNSPLK